MLDARFPCVGEKVFPVDRALADVGKMALETYGRASSAAKTAGGAGIVDVVLDVNKGETAGVFGKVGQRIFSCDVNPAEIHFHGDILGVQLGEQVVIGHLASDGRVGFEFEGVVVVGKLDAGFFGGFAGAVEERGGLLPAVGSGALRDVNPRADNVAVADDVRSLESFRPLFFHDIIG